MTEKPLPAGTPPLPQRGAGPGAGARPSGARFWVVTAATLVAVAITASLGQWQLGRADQKNALAAQREARETLPVLNQQEFLTAELSKTGAAALHDRSATLRGRWKPEATVFLDNRNMAGRVGFLVVTPLILDGTDAAILVQRGWVPRQFEDRTALPDVPTPEYPVEVAGRLAPPPSKLYEFEGAAVGRIRQNIDLGTAAQEWSLPLLPLTLQQGAPKGAPDAHPDNLLRDWPQVGHDVHKHYGYALQWFGLCALFIILYVWFQFIAPGRRQR